MGTLGSTRDISNDKKIPGSTGGNTAGVRGMQGTAGKHIGIQGATSEYLPARIEEAGGKILENIATSYRRDNSSNLQKIKQLL